MIVNAYFPKDPETIEYHINADLEDVLAFIETLVDSNHCDDIIIAGDLNVDFDRRNGNVKRLEIFLTSNRLESSWMRFNIDFSHEFEANEITYTSTIDHILWNEQFYKNVLKVGVLHLPDNISGHSPIYCDLNITCKLATNIVGKRFNGSINLRTLKQSYWNNYIATVEQKLQDVSTPVCVSCKNVHCKDERHIADIDEYTTNILEIIDNSFKASTNKYTNKKVNLKVLPGWNDEVKPFKENAMLWNAIWVSAGKPINNALHRIMKRTRNVYHYQIRKCKRSVDIIKKDKLLDACVNGKGNIFDELRKIRKVKKHVPHTMNGKTNVSETFANVYQNLYNSAGDKEEISKLLVQVNEHIGDLSISDVNMVSSEIVRKATNQVKPNKNDPVFAFNSDCLKACSPDVIPTFDQHFQNVSYSSTTYRSNCTTS